MKIGSHRRTLLDSSMYLHFGTHLSSHGPPWLCSSSSLPLSSPIVASTTPLALTVKLLAVDDNGKIDRSELALLAEALGGGVWGAARATTWLRSMDNDRDGLVTEDEVWTAYSAGSLTAAASSLGIDPPLLHKVIVLSCPTVLV